MSVFLNILRLLMQKQIVCVCVCVCVCISSAQQGVSGASAADLGTSCRCLGSIVLLLHRSRWLSLQAGKLRCAGELFGTLIEGNGESSLFHFIHNWVYVYQECRGFTRVLLVLLEAVNHTLLTTTVQNGNLSFLDSQRSSALFHLLWSLFSFCCPFTPV